MTSAIGGLTELTICTVMLTSRLVGKVDKAVKDGQFIAILDARRVGKTSIVKI